MSESNELEAIEVDFETKFKSLRCYLDDKDVHFLCNPRILPCLETENNHACLDCIIKHTNKENSILKCNICKSEHKIDDVNQLKTNDSIIDQINLNSDEIANELIEKLNKYAKDLEGKFENKEQIIKDLCEKIKKDISDRIEAIKLHLDVLHKELLDTLAKIKENVYNELEKLSTDVETKTTEYQVFTSKMEKMLENFEENREELEKDMYECQDYIEELKRLDELFHTTLRKVSFEPSEWLPDQSFICAYIGNFELDSDAKK
jgi:uncharacterized protein YoxC